MNDENKVFVNPEGYLEVVVVGEQTAESFQDIWKVAEPLLGVMKVENKRLLALLDLTFQTGFSVRSDKAAMELLEQIPYEKIAMFNVPHREVTKSIILATGKSDNTKIFDSRQEAVNWLLTE